MVLKYQKLKDVIFSPIYQNYRKIELVMKKKVSVGLLKTMVSMNDWKIELVTKKEVSVHLPKTLMRS